MPASISTFICCKDHGEFVLQAIQSVLNQTKKPSQLILLDDGSQDDTFLRFSHAAKISPFPVICLRYPKGIGHIRAYNRCLELCSGDFVHLMAADDVLLEDGWYEMSMQLFRPEVGAVTCEVQHINRKGDYLPMQTHIPFETYCKPKECLELMAQQGNFICGGGTLVRREACKPYRADLPYTADWFQWIKLCEAGWWVAAAKNMMPCPIYGYRQHSGSMSAHTRGTQEERQVCQDEIRRILSCMS